ncbi:MAG: HupE/UreJ family protein [Geminicoccaceae bacterium]|nr:HupE/UreJ family protein [Geminicoccaceae bacterium]
MTRLSLVIPSAVLALSALPDPAAAHTFGAAGAGLAEGFFHPLGGWDHLLAMLAVGVWASQLGGRAVCAAPASFVGGLLLGAVLGMAGVELVAVEAGILASLVIVGLLIALAVRLPLPAGLGLVALFGLVHGHAHGTELPQTAAPALYALGFVTASTLLHLVGVAIGTAAGRYALPLLPRLGGGAVAAAGLVGLLLG